MSDLIKKLGEIKVDFPGLNYDFLKADPQALRAILLAVAEEMPQFVEHFWSKVPESRKLTVDIGFEDFSDWLAQELVALAERLKAEER